MLRPTAGWASCGLPVSGHSPLFRCWHQAGRDIPLLVGGCIRGAVPPDAHTGWPGFWPGPWLKLPPQPDYQSLQWLSAVWMCTLFVHCRSHLQSSGVGGLLTVPGKGNASQSTSWPGVGSWPRSRLHNCWALGLGKGTSLQSASWPGVGSWLRGRLPDGWALGLGKRIALLDASWPVVGLWPRVTCFFVNLSLHVI